MTDLRPRVRDRPLKRRPQSPGETSASTAGMRSALRMDESPKCERRRSVAESGVLVPSKYKLFKQNSNKEDGSSSSSSADQTTPPKPEAPLPTTQLLDLPTDCMREVCGYLNVSELCILRKTCHQLKSFAQEELKRRKEHVFDLDHHLKFERVKVDMRNARLGHAMCYHEPENRVYVVGGMTSQGAIRHDLIFFDMERLVWDKLICNSHYGFQPSYCSFPSLCSYGNSLYLYGGFKENNGFAAVSVLDLEKKSWELNYYATITPVYGQTAIMNKRGQMVIFGGKTVTGDLSNDLLRYDCNAKLLIKVAQSGTRPAARVLAALAFCEDSHVIVCGGQTRISGPADGFLDVHLFTFEDPETKTRGFWKQVEVENAHLWPRCAPVFAPAGPTSIFFVSRPIVADHILVDSAQFCRLNDDPRMLKFAEKLIETCDPISSQDLCMAPLSESRSNSIPVRPRTPDLQRYPSDRQMVEEGTCTSARCRLIMNEEQRRECKPFNSAAAVCSRLICDHYASKEVKFFTDDFSYTLNWIPFGDGCFRQGGCVWNGLRKHFPAANNNQFLTQLVAVLYNINRLGAPKVPICAYPTLSRCRYWTGIRQEEDLHLIPLPDFLKLQVLFPVHRLVLDTPFTSTVFKLDFSKVLETNKVTFYQDPPRFMAPLFHRFAAMTRTKFGVGFVIFGGSDRSDENISTVAPVCSDTIIVS
ncbi:hypothetical protein M3Y99_00615800 [Aphelenchoides fujianensis]|nr:hypothetical protein M3Y99_00615800 [Aphelenchoides fujianensis]